MRIFLTAIIKVKPEFQKEMDTFLRSLPAQSIQEEACVAYDVHQSIDDENLYIFNEEWKSQEGLDSHNKQPYSQEFFASFDKLQEDPTIYLSK